MTPPRVLSFVVLGDPVGKGRPRFARVGKKAVRAYTPAATKSYETHVALLARAGLGRRGPLQGPLEVRIEASCPVPASWSRVKRRRAIEARMRPTTKPDIDNLAKAVLDALNGTAWRDDAQVVELACSKRYGAIPSVHVVVREIIQEDEHA